MFGMYAPFSIGFVGILSDLGIRRTLIPVGGRHEENTEGFDRHTTRAT